MTDFFARGPQGDRDSGSHGESRPEFQPNYFSEGPFGDSTGHGAEGASGDDGPEPSDAQGGESQEGSGAPAGTRRKRRRGGRGRRGARRQDQAPGAAPSGFDAELAVEPPLPELELLPFDDSPGSRSVTGDEDSSTGSSTRLPGDEGGPKRRRRGRRRGRGRGRDGASPESGDGITPWPADSSLERSADMGERSDRPAPEHPGDPLTPAAQGREQGRDQGRGGRRGSPIPAKQVAGGDAGNSQSEDSGSRRRRGSRGGRGRRREENIAAPISGPLEVEQIPFEDNDLPSMSAPAPAPAREPRRKRQDARSRDGARRESPKAQRNDDESIDPPVKPAVRRKNVILVNASDREEVRVAVIEGHQIVDFQMTVRKHKLLVNDIYRGRVVNLEPAIGAAFIDFGQGRNGFLHTSDVLSVYGEKDFTLQKLMTAKIDPDEWGGDDMHSDGHADSRREPGEAPAIATAEVAAPGTRGETAEPAAGNSEEFPEIVDDHHDVHAAEAAHAALAEARHHDDHGPDTHHDDLFSFVHDDGSEGHEGHDGHEHAGHEEVSELEPLPEHTEEVTQVPAGLSDGAAQAGEAPEAPLPGRVERDQRGRRTLRKTRGAARTTQGGPRGRGHGNGNSSRRQARPRLPITELLEKGQVVVVQITKDAIGEKGPTLTTYISIPGRHLVLMPSMARTGVSRKIEDEKERRRLKKILASLDNLSPNMGVIVRTAGVGCTRDDLQRDLDYLLALWGDFEKRLNLGRGPAPLYEESDVAIRTVRDLFNSSTEAVVVDDPEVFQRVREFTSRLMTPEDLDRIQLHDGARPLFHAYGVEQDFERIFSRRIELPSGGSIVFDQTEALVAIDVNSGKTRSEGFEFEEIALKTNLEAAPEIARQIRLRDLGGIIVCDFIDMQRASSRRAVERAFGQALSLDRARSKLGRISQFGLLELTRQRLGPGLSRMLFHNCARCRGSGRLRTVESRSGSILRRLGAALPQKGFGKVEVCAAGDVVDYLKAHCTSELKDLEGRHQKQVILVPVHDQLEDSVLRYLRPDGREVRPGGRRKR